MSAAGWHEIRTLVVNVIGFHELAEDETNPPDSVRRVIYEAQAYASGLALARKLTQLMEAEQ